MSHREPSPAGQGAPLPGAGVSFVMPVLNERAYLEHAVASVLAQDVDGPTELVIALGPSSDGTTELAERLAAAEALLRRAGAARRLVWQYRDIALDETLVQRYGERIPVLLNAEGRELGWPFSLLDILRLAGTP